jgi:transposase
MLEAVLDDIPPIRMPSGRRRQRPAKLHADKAYDHRRCRSYLRRRGIRSRIARRMIESSSTLGRHRWTIERTGAWLGGFRRLRIRYERGSERFYALAMLACAVICFNALQQPPRWPFRNVPLVWPDDVDRDLHRGNRSSVLEPVGGVPVLGPADSRPIVGIDSISMVSDRSLQDVDDAWSVLMVVHRAEDGSRLHGHHAHAKLAPCHALDLRAEVNRCKYLNRNTFRLRCRLFVAHRALLSARPGAQRSTLTQDELTCA